MGMDIHIQVRVGLLSTRSEQFVESSGEETFNDRGCEQSEAITFYWGAMAQASCVKLLDWSCEINKLK